MSVQQQEGSWHCGLFSIATAMEVCCGNNLECASFHQEVICDHLIDCFERRKLFLFPKKLHNQPECIPRPSRHHHIIDLYCYCKMPEDYNEMISCDVSGQWFHCSCVHIAPGNIPGVWECKSCCKIAKKKNDFVLIGNDQLENL